MNNKPPLKGEVLKEIKRLKGITQQDIADMLKLDKSTVSYGKTLPLTPDFEGKLRRHFSDILDMLYQSSSTAVRVKVKNETSQGQTLEERVAKIERQILELKAQLDLIISMIKK
jgi:transcriptional regulator with XRE-family HTH domain